MYPIACSVLNPVALRSAMISAFTFSSGASRCGMSPVLRSIFWVKSLAVMSNSREWLRFIAAIESSSTPWVTRRHSFIIRQFSSAIFTRA